MPNSNYVIRVVGENQAGLGEFSDELRVKTKHEGENFCSSLDFSYI